MRLSPLVRAFAVSDGLTGCNVCDSDPHDECHDVRHPQGELESVPSRAGTYYSHSIVPGGLLVTSSTTRFTAGTSLVMRVEIRASTSYGIRAQSAVIASSLVTGRSTTG